MITFESMFVYSEQNSERLSYVLHVLSEHLSIHFEQTKHLSKVREGDSFINYSAEYHEGGLWIIPEGLLLEKGIREASVPYSVEAKLIFPSSKENAYPFDLLSAVFYMLSRYEEYLPFKSDSHGRFCSSESINAKLKSTRIAFVDRWIIQLGEILKSDFQQYPTYKEYQYTPTVDVDIAFAYRHRPLWLTLANYIKDLSKGNFSAINKRFKVNVGLHEDPYDTFGVLKNTYQKQKALLFFQLGERSEFDKNLSPYHPEMRKLIFACKQWSTIGIHPSYASNSNGNKLKEEVRMLESIINEKLSSSRQHFLKLKFPDTYQSLLAQGIEHDYTLGYAEEVGFRAGTAHPFPFYDLEKEQITKLILVPLCIMDGTLKSYLGLNPQEAKKVISEIISEVKHVNGTFVSLWHNTSFSEIDLWEEWNEVFTYMHNEAIK